MNKSLLVFSMIVVFTAIIACKGPEKSADASQQTKTETPVSDTPSKQAVPRSDAPASSGDTGKNEAARVAKSGSDIVVETSNRIGRKLGLDEPVTSQITAILKDAFYSIGGKMEVMYPAEEARALGTKIVKNSETPIMALLNPEQQANFKRFLSK